jgi:murein DD-endopeptidase MepM/ murein hydrolase activator NlpD
MAPVTSKFGPRDVPAAGGSHNHQGVDYGVPIGTPIYANKELTVTRAGPASGYGNAVYAVDNEGTQYRFGHLDSIPDSTKVGTKIQPGELIAMSGNSGVSSGPHLHYEVRQGGKAVDPLTTIDPTTGKPYENNASFAQDGSSLRKSSPGKSSDYVPHSHDDHGPESKKKKAPPGKNPNADTPNPNTTPNNTAPSNRPQGIKIPLMNPLLKLGDK